MGKGTITSEVGDGEYTIEVDYGSDIATARLGKLNTEKASLEANIAAIEGSILALEIAVGTSLAQLNAAIATYNASEKTPEDDAALKAAASGPVENREILSQAQSRLSGYQLQLAYVDARIAEIGALDLVQTKDVWCVDYTLEGSGEVSTIEINGEQPQVLIAPGAIPFADPYGCMAARQVQSPAQIFFNAAVLPGWQKWKPTYRVGVLSAINTTTDTGTVTLDSANSSAQNLNINQENVLTDVPIEYMECDALAFENGDRVVVAFDGQDWNSPKVIGFESNPRACSQIYVHRAYSGDGIGYGTWQYGLFSIPGIWEAYNASPANVEIWSRNSAGDIATYPWGKATHAAGRYILASGTGGYLFVFADSSFYQGNPTYDDFYDPKIPLIPDVIYLDFTIGGATSVPEFFIKINNAYSSQFRCDLSAFSIAGAKMDQQWLDVDPSAGNFFAWDVLPTSFSFAGPPDDP